MAEYKKEGDADMIDGSVDAKLKTAIVIGEGEQQLEVKPEVTTMKATLENGQLGTITANIDADYRNSAAPFTQPLDLNLQLNNVVYDHSAGEVDGGGSLALNAPATVTVGENHMTLAEGSGVTANVTKNKLTSFNGNVGYEAAVKIANAVAEVDGSINADYKNEGTPTFGGTFTAAVTNDFTLGEGANQLTVHKDATNITATVAENDLQNVVFNLDADYTRQAGGPLTTPLELNVKLQNATYEKSDSTVSGSGSITLKSDAEIAVGSGNQLTLKAESSVNGEVKKNDLTSFNGDVGYEAKVKLGDQTAELSGNANMDYTKKGEAATINGSISGQLDSELTFGSGNNIIKVLPGETNMKAQVTNNAFDQISFNLSLIHISEPTRPY